ncbi:uncharacterized protein LOC126985498 [Eriocheir sinensis]|uniref:uncharacterized protein LOC126985498 n=1 Tax=Eriocheir sinensis TaxID=95602 RepID=UPI0021CA9843|nr:uncharacterized protein LOC126985498 [Eriocheir sinensis]
MSLREALKVVVVVVVMVSVREGAEGLPGKYKTFPELRGKWLPPSAAVATVKATCDGCMEKCVKHRQCNAFACSQLEGTCVMYAKGKDMAVVRVDSYTLYVQARDEEDGYVLWGTHYIILERKRLTPKQALIACDTKYFGTLPIITDDDMNQFLSNLMQMPPVFEATIGITDEAKEGHWTYFNGRDVGYTNWSWKGVWNLKDRNCAAMTIDGTWIMTDCWQPNYYFCQIPLY